MEHYECLLNGARGIYVAQNFAETYGAAWGVTPEDMAALLAGPEHADYWETWDDVLGYATYTDTENGITYNLHVGESGDVFAVNMAQLRDEMEA